MSNTIKVSFELEGDKAIRTMTSITKKMENFGNQSSESFKKTNTAMSSFLGNLGAIGASKAIGYLTGQFSESIDAALNFENSIAEINTLLPTTEKLTQDQTQALLDLSAAYGKDVQTQTKAYYDIVSAGIKGAAAQMDVLEVSNKAAVAGLTDVNVAADVLTTSLNSFASQGLTATQASDALFAAVREGKTTFGELAASLGGVAPLAASAGVSFSDMTGTIAAFTKKGILTARAVTGLKGVLAAVIKPSEDATKAAKEMGIDFSTAAIKSKGLAEFLHEVGKATGGSESQLARLVPRVEGLTPLLGALSGDFNEFSGVLDATRDSAGATDKAFQVMEKSSKFKLDVAKKEISSLWIELGNKLTPQLSLITHYWTNLAKTMIDDKGTTKAKERMDELTQSIKNQSATVKFYKKVYERESGDGWLSSILGNKNKAALHLIESENQLKKYNEELNKLKRDAELESAKNEQKAFDDEIALMDKEAQARIKAESDKVAAEKLANQERVKSKQETNTLLDQLDIAAAQSEFDRGAAELMFFEDNKSKEVSIIEKALGKEKALRELVKINNIENEKQKIDALSKLHDAAAAKQLEKDQQLAKAKLEAKVANNEASLEVDRENQSILDELDIATAQNEFDREALRVDNLSKSKNKELLFLEKALGKENALKELARIKNIKDDTKRKAELGKLRDRAVEQDKASLINLRQFENMSNQEKINAQKQTLSSIAGLASSNNKVLFTIGKAASLANAGISVSEGVTKALAAFPPPYSFAAAAAVGAAGAVQIAKIASSSPPKYAEGGIIGGTSSVNDRNLAQVNAGEMIFNRRQQENLFNQVNAGGVGSGGNTININSPTFLNEEMVDDVIDLINDRVELGNKKLISSEVA